MNKTMKQLSLMLLGSALWLVCTVVPGNSGAIANASLVVKASNLVVSPAYADEDEHESAEKDEEADDHEDEDKKDDESSEKEDDSDHHDKKEHEKDD